MQYYNKHVIVRYIQHIQKYIQDIDKYIQYFQHIQDVYKIAVGPAGRRPGGLALGPGPGPRLRAGGRPAGRAAGYFVYMFYILFIYCLYLFIACMLFFIGCIYVAIKCFNNL